MTTNTQSLPTLMTRTENSQILSSGHVALTKIANRNTMQKLNVNNKRDLYKQEIGVSLCKSKRKRRKIEDLDRPFKCDYAACGRLYSSEHALNQHIKIKHQANLTRATGKKLSPQPVESTTKGKSEPSADKSVPSNTEMPATIPRSTSQNSPAQFESRNSSEPSSKSPVHRQAPKALPWSKCYHSNNAHTTYPPKDHPENEPDSFKNDTNINQPGQPRFLPPNSATTIRSLHSGSSLLRSGSCPVPNVNMRKTPIKDAIPRPRSHQSMNYGPQRAPLYKFSSDSSLLDTFDRDIPAKRGIGQFCSQPARPRCVYPQMVSESQTSCNLAARKEDTVRRAVSYATSDMTAEAAEELRLRTHAIKAKLDKADTLTNLNRASLQEIQTPAMSRRGTITSTMDGYECGNQLMGSPERRFSGMSSSTLVNETSQGVGPKIDLMQMVTSISSNDTAASTPVDVSAFCAWIADTFDFQNIKGVDEISSARI